MKQDIELDNLLTEYQKLMNAKEEDFSIVRENAMFLAMSEKYGKNPEDREIIIKSLKNRIEVLKEKEQIRKALKLVEDFKKCER